ncbi:MAG: acyl-CoA dehydrogenase family protein [Ilumatobacteraceae bacterium]
MTGSTTIRTAAEVAREHADEAERGRRLPAATVAALADAGAFTLCLPEAYGGAGGGPLAMIDAVAEIAAGDASAGWCAGIASTTSSLAIFLEPSVASSVFVSPQVATGGVFAPNGRGVVDGDHVRVTGRWQWGSGTQHCDWIVGGAMCDDGTQRICFFRPDAIEFHDTWHVGGMRGTGSLDFSVDDAAVPLDHTIRVGLDQPMVDDPIARFPNFTLLALGIAATGVGNARRALDELRDLAIGKTPQFSSKTLAQSGLRRPSSLVPRRDGARRGHSCAPRSGRRGMRRSPADRSTSMPGSPCAWRQRTRRASAWPSPPPPTSWRAARPCTTRRGSDDACATRTS